MYISETFTLLYHTHTVTEFLVMRLSVIADMYCKYNLAVKASTACPGLVCTGLLHSTYLLLHV